MLWGNWPLNVLWQHSVVSCFAQVNVPRYFAKIHLCWCCKWFDRKYKVPFKKELDKVKITFSLTPKAPHFVGLREPRRERQQVSSPAYRWQYVANIWEIPDSLVSIFGHYIPSSLIATIFCSLLRHTSWLANQFQHHTCFLFWLVQWFHREFANLLIVVELLNNVPRKMVSLVNCLNISSGSIKWSIVEVS